MRLLVAIVLCVSGSTAAAQEVERGTRVEGGSRRGGFGFFTVGYLATDQSDVNGALRAAGFPSSPWGGLTLGGGGYFLLGRMLVGGTGSWLLSSPTTRGDRFVDARGGFGLLEVGFVALEHESWWLYPFVGAGGGGMSYRVASGGAGSFADALAGPYHEASVDTGGWLAEVGAGLDLFHGMEDPRGTGGPIVGLRAGWMFQPSGTSWSANERDLAGGPDLRLGGPFVRIVLGGGGFSWR